jgi:hypothetical protein
MEVSDVNYTTELAKSVPDNWVLILAAYFSGALITLFGVL